MVADDKNFDLRSLLSQKARGLQSICSWHAYIQQDYIRPQVVCSLYYLFGIYGLSTNFVVFAVGQKSSNAAANQWIVIRNKNSHSAQRIP